MPKKAVLLYISESKGILPSVNNRKLTEYIHIFTIQIYKLYFKHRRKRDASEAKENK